MSSTLDCTLGGPPCVSMHDISPAGLPTTKLPNNGYHVFFAIVIMIILSGLTVSARIWTRISSGHMGADDYAVVASLASCVTQMTFWGLAVRYGYGGDYLLLESYNRRMFNKLWFLGAIFYPVTIASYKTSVILLNKRIFVQKPFQIASWIILVLNVCWATGNTLGWIFQCIPVSMMWGDATEGVCWDMKGEWLSLVTWNVFTDVVIITMPLPMVWQLSLKTRDKVLLSGLFLLGASVTVCSLLSCSAVVESLQQKQGNNNVTFAMANLFQVLESNIGIIASCLPVLRAPLKRVFPKIFSTTKGSNGRYYSYEDRYKNEYALQNVSTHSKASGRPGWRNSTSFSSQDVFRTVPRKSDELGIIHETDIGHNPYSREVEAGSQYHKGEGIRKTVEVTVER